MRVAVAQGLADDLLHVRVVQFALPGSFPGDQLVDCVSGGAASRSGAIVDGKNLCDLSRLELADGVVDFRSVRSCDSNTKPMSPPFEAVLGSSEKFMATAPVAACVEEDHRAACASCWRASCRR